MVAEGERYLNHYTGKIVTVKAVKSVRVGPGDRHVDIVILEGGARWQAGEAAA
jgi:hypothetical protein